MLLLVAVGLAAAASSACAGSRPGDGPRDEVPLPAVTTTEPPSSTALTATTTTTAPRREATIAFAGDVLIHSAVWRAAATGGGYDFTPMLAPIAPLVSAADLAICHLEVTLGLPGDPPSTYPRFRAPRELAGNLAAAGWDGCSLASNHALDFGEQGVVATLDAFDEVGLGHAGTARTPEERARGARYEPGGIRVAHLSYAYWFNGLTVPPGRAWLADQIDPTLILADARAARAQGAELVVVSLHWGDEYRHEVSAAQQAVAEALAAVPGAVDLVVGHHAHVVQPISKVGALWVVWGMGNLLSDNSPPCCVREATDGVVVTATVGDTDDGVAVTGIEFTPTWNERDTFRVLPAATALAEGTASPQLAADLRASFDRTTYIALSLGAAGAGVAPDRQRPP